MVYYLSMKRIPYKVRLWLSTGLFAWAIVAFIASIVYYVNTMQLWAIIAIPIIAFISFTLSIVFFPRFKDDGTLTIEQKQKVKDQHSISQRNLRNYLLAIKNGKN